MENGKSCKIFTTHKPQELEWVEVVESKKYLCGIFLVTCSCEKNYYFLVQNIYGSFCFAQLEWEASKIICME